MTGSKPGYRWMHTIPAAVAVGWLCAGVQAQPAASRPAASAPSASSAPLAALPPAGGPDADHPLHWFDARANLALQAEELSIWADRAWFAELVGLLESLARERAVAPPAWALAMSGVDAPSPELRGRLEGWRMLLSGRVTIVGEVRWPELDLVAVVELPDPPAGAADAPASQRQTPRGSPAGQLAATSPADAFAERTHRDPRIAELARRLGWREVTPLAPDLLVWEELGLLIRARGHILVMFPAGSRMAKVPLERLTEGAKGAAASSAVAPDAGVGSDPATAPLRPLPEDVLFRRSWRPVDRGELWAFYRPQAGSGAIIPGAGLLVDLTAASGVVTAGRDELLLNLVLSLEPAYLRLLESWPVLARLASEAGGLGPIGRAGPGGAVSGSGSAGGGESAAGAESTGPASARWRSVSGTLVQARVPMVPPRQLEELGPVITGAVRLWEAAHAGADVEGQILARLGAEMLLLWSDAPAELSELAGLPYPSFALAVPLAGSETLDRLLERAPEVLNALLAAQGLDQRVVPVQGLEPRLYRWGAGLALRDMGLLPTGFEGLACTELVWGHAGGWLVAGTEYGLVRRCLLRQALPAEAAGAGLAVGSAGSTPAGESAAAGSSTAGDALPTLRAQTGDAVIIHARTAAAARLLLEWLRALEAAQPALFDDAAWERFARQISPPPPRLGITLATAELDAPATGALLVDQVLAGSPAERAGLQRGDLLVAVNGELLAASDPLATFLRHIYARPDLPDEPVRLTFRRNGQPAETVVRLAGRPPAGPNPLRQVRLWAQLLERVERVDYEQHLSQQALHVRLRIRWPVQPRSDRAEPASPRR